LRYTTYIYTEDRKLANEIKGNLGGIFSFKIISSSHILKEILVKQIAKIIIFDSHLINDLAEEYLTSDIFNKKIVISNMKKEISQHNVIQINSLKSIIKTTMNDIYNHVPLLLNSNEGKLFIYQNDIVFIEALRNKCIIYMKDRIEYTINHYLKELNYLLNPYYFSNSHRSYIINRNFIKKIYMEDGTYIIDFYSINEQAIMSKAKYRDWVY
jgi:DNA-binding LytR/AlgR family response regulator